MISEFIAKKLKQARYEILEDRTYYGEVPGFRGVWANAKTLEDCRSELQSALEDWIVFKLRDGDKIPGLRVDSVRKRHLIKHA
ncbi:type II toxin-antitoxin system HicB family antitoxin [Candidatus Giovannonibacteria bacterium]|nr:type II toxin-antitoxin system HicB family antitoxin [Candidatus Giovannonibacteria bacterium]